MTPRRQQRLAILLCVLLGTAATAALTTAAFQQNLLFFYTPTQVISGDIDATRPFRLGGLVATGTVQRQSGSLSVEFAITDTASEVAVSYTGVLPDLFREGKGVVVRGSWKNDVLIAEEVLAKHDENYYPPEVEDALEAAKTLQQ